MSFATAVLTGELTDTAALIDAALAFFGEGDRAEEDGGDPAAAGFLVLITFAP
jgi:hypothetical protein